MSLKIPKEIRKEVEDIVYNIADQSNYLANNNYANGKLIAELVGRQDVGGKLADFMQKSDIKTYIKHTVLKNYAKKNSEKAKPRDIKVVIRELFGIKVEEIDKDNKSKVALFKSIQSNRQNYYVIVAEGSFVKWETALRKALFYASGKPFAEDKKNTVFILLNIFAKYKKITDADKKCLSNALDRCGAKVNIFGESK